MKNLVESQPGVRRSYRRLLKIVMTGLFFTISAAVLLRFSISTQSGPPQLSLDSPQASASEHQAKDSNSEKVESPPDSTPILVSQSQRPPKTKAADSAHQEPQRSRFDSLVQEDFFAGFAGNQEALNRAMKVCEDALAKNPDHAEAMVWHGAGLLYISGKSFREGDIGKGMEIWQRGLKEMDDAVALKPDEAGVLIVRGTMLLTASRYTPDQEQARLLLKKGVGDFEKALRLQNSYFNDLPVQSRGELLMGLADGWQRLGDLDKARQYYQRIVSECRGSDYAEKAKAWLEKSASGTRN